MLILPEHKNCPNCHMIIVVEQVITIHQDYSLYISYDISDEFCSNSCPIKFNQTRDANNHIIRYNCNDLSGKYMITQTEIGFSIICMEEFWDPKKMSELFIPDVIFDIFDFDTLTDRIQFLLNFQ